MQYNTGKECVKLPEYGRTIENLVTHACSLPTKEERTKCAYSIIDIMGNLFPYLRDSEDYKHKLWDHLAIMSDFKLDIDYPCEPISPENLRSRPQPMAYPTTKTEERHYGNSIMLMIEEVMRQPQGAKRDAMVRMVANHMKKCYLLWNNTSVVDGKIIDDLCYLSNRTISPEEVSFKLTESRNIFDIKKKKNNPMNNNNQKAKPFQRNNGPLQKRK